MLRHGFTAIRTGDLVDTYARSAFEDTRRKAEKFGARGTTVQATKPDTVTSTPSPAPPTNGGAHG